MVCDFHCSVPWFLYVSKIVLRSALFSLVNMTVSKSDLDLHLSESDWCRLVIRFWLSYFGCTPTLQDFQREFSGHHTNQLEILYEMPSGHRPGWTVAIVLFLALGHMLSVHSG